MFTKISVLVPTRKRIPQLRTLLESFTDTRSYLCAELIFRIDDDDVESGLVLADSAWPVVTGPRLNGYRSLPTFFEEMRRVASGDVLMAGNDDMVFKTLRWAETVLEVANRYPDGIFDLAVDTFNAKAVPFSIVSRKAVEMMGHFQDPRIYWGDVYLRDVMATFGRVIPVPVRVDHCWMGKTPDQTFQEAKQGERRNWDAAYWATHRAAVAAAVKRLQVSA